MKKELAAKVEEAKKLGAQAFAAGIKCAPALDPKVEGLLFLKYDPFNTPAKERKVYHRNNMAVLTAWTRGWTEANLAAPVEGL